MPQQTRGILLFMESSIIFFTGEKLFALFICVRLLNFFNTESLFIISPLRKDGLCFPNLHVQCININIYIYINKFYIISHIFLFRIIFSLFKLSCWMATLLQALALERITPKYIYCNICYNERCSGTNHVRSSIPHRTSALPQSTTHPVNYICLPRRSMAEPHASSSSRQSFLRLPRADITTDSPVQEPEGLRHDVADVRQAQQHQGNPQDGVKDRHYFSPLCLGSYVPVTCKRQKQN